ncbi:hypothetical protein Q5752_002779 [Cryptotrichosporon argae]
MSAPTVSSPPPYVHPDYLSTLDFLALAGLDSEPSYASPQTGAAQHHHPHHLDHTRDAPSQPPHHAAAAQTVPLTEHTGPPFRPSEPLSRTGSGESAAIERTASGSGSARAGWGAQASQRGRDGPEHGSDDPDYYDSGLSQASERPTDVDTGAAEASGSGSSARTHHAGPIDGFDGFDMSYISGGLDPSGTLRRQLEQIHMQSPFLDGTNPPHDLAQMFLASPVMPPAPAPASRDAGAGAKAWRPVSVVGGLLTPGPSGELGPDARMDLMSPVQLELLLRGDLEGINMSALPLLSPALTHNPPSSSFASPLVQPTYAAAAPPPGNPSAIEQLQLQQQQFQQQLSMLQHQQRQLEAAAAAVAAASAHTSPYVAPHNPAVTPGFAPGSTGSMGAPSPGYFSPLASPALEATLGRRQSLALASPALHPHAHAHGHAHANGHGHGQMPARAAYPLSALSSPALNPVGSSGGANQTLSPALGPAHGADLGDPDFLAAFQGALEPPHAGVAHTHPHAHALAQQQQQQLSHPPSSLASPAMAPTTGPHRNSLPAKSRPSPMMKPTARTHVRHASGSVPPSPLAFRAGHSTAAAGSGALSPATLDHRGYVQHQHQLAAGSLAASASASASSTPSPVDLCAIMPPPPVPAPQAHRSVMPMTPASLMNMGDARARAGSSAQLAAHAEAGKRAGPSTRAAAAKRAPPAPKKGSRLVPAGGAAAAKRALAIRPGAVGVRSATKGAAAASASASASVSAGAGAAAVSGAAGGSAEPEARKTSHKAAEQKRRDSLKAGFDELRLLLPPINTDALDPESGEPIPGSSAPRLLPKSSRVPDDNPNRAVSKVALLRFGNEYIARLHAKVEKRDAYIDLLRDEVRRLRARGLGNDGEDGQDEEDEDEVRGDDGEDLLEMDMLEGEEDDLDDGEHDDDADDDADMDLDLDPGPALAALLPAKTKSPALGPTTRRPSLSSKSSSGTTVVPKRGGS